jgi:isopentenyl phosphate kinase
MVYGDVALDEVQGGTIISTEQIFAFLARELRPDRLVLVGAVDGVHDGDPLRNASAKPIPEITEANWEAVQATLGGSYATDVTGGMRTKVEATVELVRDLPGLTGHIISGERPGTLERLLLDPTTATGGTLVHWQGTVPTGT